jgi:Tol biopolymer transport system component
VAAVISPAGADVREWVEDQVGEEEAGPTLSSLPAPGRILVDSPEGPWIVQEDGSKRLLGDYTESTWSPRGLYVAAAKGHELVAVDPRGEPRWSLGRDGPVRSPRWSPDGFRIAYLSGNDLRVVAGDGTGDHLVRAAADTAVPPAWRPGPGHIVAYGDLRGRVHVVDADSGRELSHTESWLPMDLAWSPAGDLLYMLTANRLRVYRPNGELEREIPMPLISRRLAVSSLGDIAVVSGDKARARDRVVLVSPAGKRRQLFAAPGGFRDVTWSPAGRYLLLSWRNANQWLFLDPRRPESTRAVGNISQQFSPGDSDPEFPSVSGWCCPITP